ncbi:hypothetical protein [Deinococcus multiflagellatus]|uniref:hypothetical protein n=1 Tax=Deinococcus multiflagellatus TaxID=1656887 RepID=UPI001CCD4CB1|nr:hypothetical protein [Deinococcus multiflagellatus]MBZ9713665.1 hypothetical protein [Deinococcus multiflagellatus]
MTREDGSQGRDWVSEPVWFSPAIVIGALTPRHLCVIVHPGQGQGNVVCELPLHLFPFHLRLPNTWVTLEYDRRVGRVVRVTAGQEEPPYPGDTAAE